MDEWMIDSPHLRSFIDAVRTIQLSAPTPQAALAEMRPHFAALMADPDWLPQAFRESDPRSGMGAGIATWLLYRAGDGGLSLFALVVPPGAATPVHDHLAWGLVGLYVGEQQEDVYEPDGEASGQGQAPLELVTTQRLHAGDFYELMPPTGDIHRVATIGTEPSVSLHLLGNDTGCVWRHRYDPAAGTRSDFRSGYTNRPCHDADIGSR